MEEYVGMKIHVNMWICAISTYLDRVSRIRLYILYCTSPQSKQYGNTYYIPRPSKHIGRNGGSFSKSPYAIRPYAKAILRQATGKTVNFLLSVQWYLSITIPSGRDTRTMVPVWYKHGISMVLVLFYSYKIMGWVSTQLGWNFYTVRNLHSMSSGHLLVVAWAYQLILQTLCKYLAGT